MRTNALAGFLPPNDSSGQGKGYVSYTVQPKTSDATGAVINAQAQVVFDTNAAIDTPLLANTIDSGAPTSSVTALAATESFTGFLVSWSGQDDASGSGIASYDIYVSDNGGAFTPWLSNATFTSSTYPGQAGHSYGFYSVAADNVGNIQGTPPAAQTTTTVASDAAAAFATLTNGALVVDGTAGSDTITLQTDGSGNLTATLNGQTSESLPLSQIASIDVEGEAGSDTITLGAGVPAASVQGGRGKDIINGGAGDDTLAGGRGADVITAGSGNDLLRGGRGADSLVAGSGNDTLLGGADDDTLHGGAGDDLLNGNAGTNKLRGGAGNNTFYAVSGTDDQIFVGSAANDSLFYGAGDQFVIESGSIPPGNQTLVS